MWVTMQIPLLKKSRKKRIKFWLRRNATRRGEMVEYRQNELVKVWLAILEDSSADRGPGIYAATLFTESSGIGRSKETMK